MPSFFRTLGAVTACTVLSIVLAVTASAVPASAADPVVPDDDKLHCSVGVFGRTPSTVPTGAPPWAEPHHYVQWGPDMGFSMVYSCVGDAFGRVQDINGTGLFPSRSSMSSFRYTGIRTGFSSSAGGNTAPDSPLIRFVPDVPGQGDVWQRMGPANTTNEGSPFQHCDGHTTVLDGNGRADGATKNLKDGLFRKAAGACYGVGVGFMTYWEPTLTDWMAADGRVRFSVRYDVEPTQGQCTAGGTGNNGNGSDAWRCPTPAADVRFFVPRVGPQMILFGARPAAGSTADFNYLSYQGSWTEAGMSGELVTESGSSVPVPYPPYDVPGAEPGGGTCEITGWILRNTTDDRQWTDKSPDRYGIILTSGHAHTLTVTFKGRPSTIRLQVRKDGQTVLTRQVMRPAPPRVTFNLTGTGDRVLLAVTCIGSDGDIDPDGQEVITDEPENERSTFEECVDQESTNWTSPSSYWRWGVNAVGCLLSHLFVPYKPLSERFYELRSSSEAGEWVSNSGAALHAGLTGVAATNPANCEGPTINRPEAGLVEQQPFNVCSGSSLRTAADAVRIVISGALVLWTLVRLWRITSGAINGDAVEVYQAEFNTDTSSGGRWV